jgi:transcriptional regulator of acetoin/glycerol metabolism
VKIIDLQTKTGDTGYIQNAEVTHEKTSNAYTSQASRQEAQSNLGVTSKTLDAHSAIPQKESNERKTRKTKAQMNSEYDKVVKLLEAGITALEIQAMLGIQSSQVAKHCQRAFMEGHEYVKPEYETMLGASFDEMIREHLEADKNQLIKVVTTDTDSGKEVILRALPLKIKR